MMSKLIYTIALFLFSTAGFSQTDNELLKMGDAAMVNGQYTNAVYYYAFILFKVKEGEEANYYPYEITTTYKEPKKNEKGSIIPPTNPTKKEITLIHKLAEAYLMADDYKNAELWYESALKYPSEEFPLTHFNYAVALMYNQKYEAAQKEFEAYQSEIGDPTSETYTQATSLIASCQFALNPINTDPDVLFGELPSYINEGSTNFGLQYTSDEHVVFSSARVNSKDDTLVSNANFLLDMYIAPIESDGTIGQPERFPFTVNSRDYHEGSAVLSADGNTIFFTKMDPANRNETKIYASRNLNGVWLSPFALDPHVNLDGFRSLTPYLNEAGDKLYFSSNRPGGQGGLDLWYVNVDAQGQTSRPVNLGDQVNSSGDELSPFFHEVSQTLYYASTGHIGFGGQDIFFNTYNEDTDSYGQTTNAGAPINSSADDSYFIIDKKLENGYVTSNREVCSSCDSIYSLNVHCNKLYQIQRPEIKFAISGYVYDKKTNEIIPNAKIEFKDVSYEWAHFEIFADENGYYEHELIPELELFMRASQIDFFADKAIITTIGEIESKNFEQNFYLERIPKTEITIEGIEYDFDSANLRPESELILDNLIEFLQLNDNLVIEIRSHTDQRGKDSYNLNLSERRAQSVVDYLIAHDIPMDRLVPKGYGETMPAEITDENGVVTALTIEHIASLRTKVEREEAHQRNRRTAFFVLEQK